MIGSDGVLWIRLNKIIDPSVNQSSSEINT